MYPAEMYECTILHTELKVLSTEATSFTLASLAGLLIIDVNSSGFFWRQNSFSVLTAF